MRIDILRPFGLLAECILKGLGTDRNPVRALKVAEAPEASEDPYAADIAALVLFGGQAGKYDYKRAGELFQKSQKAIRALAEAGDARAQAYLAGMLLAHRSTLEDHCASFATFQGTGEEESDEKKTVEPRDQAEEEKEGMEWAKKAAAQGHAPAQGLLAKYYLEQKDTETALSYANAASAQGEASSYYVLGNLAKDEKEAVKHWTHGAELHDAASSVALGEYLVKRDGPESKRGANKEQSRVAQLFQFAAEQGDPQGEYMWATTLLNGLYGEEVDKKHGLVFLMRADDHGNAKAHAELNELEGEYSDGDDKDEE